jgi:hypothetical protein
MTPPVGRLARRRIFRTIHARRRGVRNGFCGIA